MKNLPVSDELHSRAWLMKIRGKASTFDEIADKAFNALAEKEGWDDLVKKENL